MITIARSRRRRRGLIRTSNPLGAPGSELLTGLEETPDGPFWTAIWTTADEVVTPPQSGELVGAVNIAAQDVCPDSRVTHGQLPTDPLTVGLLLLALDVDPLDAAPSSDRCESVRENSVR